MKRSILGAAILAGAFSLSGCVFDSDKTEPKNVIFFLGDGMGTTTQTAARIYSAGEDGQLTIDTLPETAWIRTYSKDAQVTDSAPSMAAYMTGVKMRNEVISMSDDTIATPPADSNTTNNCSSTNGHAVTTLLELAKSANKSVGVVTTTRVTHATPAATYAHICHRDLENHIAAQLVPGGAGFNSALIDGVDVIFGGGRKHFLPNTVSGGYRTDGRDLTAELKSKGYSYVTDRSGLNNLDPSKDGKVLGLFTSSHMSYDLDRNPSSEPSLAEMTSKAIDLLSRNKKKGYFLMVEGGRIDHALHDSNAKRALVDTVAFDNAIKTALSKVDLGNTLIVVTSDHDHTLVLNGYAQRTGKTTDTNPGVLGTVKNVVSGSEEHDADGQAYSILGFGNSSNRVAGARTAITDSMTSANDYRQEGAVRVAAGSETHGGTDVPLEATGLGADQFHGFLTNTEVFQLIRNAVGF